MQPRGKKDKARMRLRDGPSSCRRGQRLADADDGSCSNSIRPTHPLGGVGIKRLGGRVSVVIDNLKKKKKKTAVTAVLVVVLTGCSGSTARDGALRTRAPTFLGH